MSTNNMFYGEIKIYQYFFKKKCLIWSCAWSCISESNDLLFFASSLAFGSIYVEPYHLQSSNLAYTSSQEQTL